MTAIKNLHQSVYALWLSSGLDDLFKSYWDTDNPEEFISLHDQEASPEQPAPYCVFEQAESATMVRMTGGDTVGTSNKKHEIKEVGWRFQIHTAQTAELSAKQLAALLAEELTKVFGGHPTVAPQAVPDVLQTTLVGEAAIRTESENYAWLLNYSFMLDTSVAY